MITLSHAETRNLSKEEVSLRIRKTFACRSVIVAQEKHQESEKHQALGIHFHVAVLNDNASKNNATSIIRKCFPEFEGRQCQVTFHKGWNTICTYVSKEDRDPHIWGEYSLEQVLSIAQNASKKVKNLKVPNSELFNQLSKCKEWLEVYNQPSLVNELFRRYQNIQKIHEDLRVLEMQRGSFAERIVSYLNQKGWPLEYSPEEILEKYLLLDWIACQLAFDRPIKTKQLFLYGEPSTQKTLILHFLAKAMRIYFVSSRLNDFSEADNYYDLWVFDEFHDENSEETYQNANETHRANTLLKVLDGQECRLDSKYGKIFKKNRNVPILMIANKLPRRVKKPGPMQERFLRLRFQSQITNLEEERIIATLWGCFFRRIDRQFSFLPNNQTGISIKYNSVTALIGPFFPPFILKGVDNEEESKERVTCAFTKEKEMLIGTRKLGKNKEGNYPFLELNSVELALCEADLSLIQFAFIPILKKEGNTQMSNQTLTEVFKDPREGSSFRILRNTADSDFLVWPAYIAPIKTSKTISGYSYDKPWPNNEKLEKKENGQEKEWPVKLLVWNQRWVEHMKHSLTQEQPTSYPEPRGFWKISLGVPPRVYDGDWAEDD